MNKQIKTATIRAGYVHIATPRENDLSGKTEYSMQLIMPKGGETAKQIQTMVDAIAKEKWGNDIPHNMKQPLRDADKEGKKEEHMRGMMFMNIRSEDRPGVVGPDGFPKGDPEECRSGDYYRIAMGGFPYLKPSPGISFGLNNVQWVKKGDSLSGRKRAEDDFSAIDDNEDSMLG